MKEVKPNQLQAVEKTCQSWEKIQNAIPILPVSEIWGNIFTYEPSLKRGGHMVVTNARLIFCPHDAPGIWPWHFAELTGLNIQSNLFKSIIKVEKPEVQLRWQTLPKGGKAVQEAWDSWKAIGKSNFPYPEFEIQIEGSKNSVECGLCRLPIELSDSLHENIEVRCGACYSLNKMIHPWHGIPL